MGWVLFCVLITGILVGASLGIESERHAAIQHGCAHYDVLTATFTWGKP